MTKMCYHPWVGLDISPQGNFKPCCKYKNTVANSLTDYQSSSELSQLKKDFLNGNQPNACGRCWQDEDAGLPSKRIIDNEYVFQNLKPSLDSLKVLSLPFGNLCNLACRICNSGASSKWTQEEQRIKSIFPTINIRQPSTFHRNDEFIDSIKMLTSDLIRLEIPGGEPFYADKQLHKNFLEHFIHPEKISLHYITNGTVWPDRELIELWKKFRHVDIQISLDGIEKKFEYSRWPSDWNSVSFHIGKYLALKTDMPNVQLSISYTVSIFTLYDLPEFLDWCKIHDLPDPYLGLLTKPAHYDITVLPYAAKEEISRRFKTHQQLTPILSAMWAQDNSKLLDITINYVKILDKQRNQSFAETFPELYNLLGERCQTLYQQY